LNLGLLSRCLDCLDFRSTAFDRHVMVSPDHSFIHGRLNIDYRNRGYTICHLYNDTGLYSIQYSLIIEHDRILKSCHG
jgi:hypothetical protein